MKIIDTIAAWLMFLTGFVYVIVVGYWHPRGTVLDTPLFWLAVAMINFLRIAEGNAQIPRIRIVAIAANVMVVALEFLRIGLTARHITADWGSDYVLREFRINFVWWLPYFIIAALALIETLCSFRRTDNLARTAAA